MNRTIAIGARPRKGFTLLEVAIVATLAGIILGLAVPKIRNFRDVASLDGAAHELARDLSRARMQAVKRNQKLMLARLADTAYQVGDEPPRRLPAGISFKEASAEFITFNSMGIVADGLSHIGLTSPSSLSRVIVIRGSGHVSVQ